MILRCRQQGADTTVAEAMPSPAQVSLAYQASVPVASGDTLFLVCKARRVSCGHILCLRPNSMQIQAPQALYLQCFNIRLTQSRGLRAVRRLFQSPARIDVTQVAASIPAARSAAVRAGFGKAVNMVSKEGFRLISFHQPARCGWQSEVTARVCARQQTIAGQDKPHHVLAMCSSRITPRYAVSCISMSPKSASICLKIGWHRL